MVVVCPRLTFFSFVCLNPIAADSPRCLRFFLGCQRYCGMIVSQCLRPDGSEVWVTEAPEAHSTPTLIDGYVYVLSQTWRSLIAFYQPNGTLAWKQTLPVSNLTTITGVFD